MNLDLIFVVKGDGTYQDTPLKKLRAQENYSDSFVVIANRGGIVKSNIRLLSRTDKVITQFLLPTLEKPADLIGDKSYFQEYANANVWRIAVDKKALKEISMSYSGQIEVSFTFTSLVDDSRATNFIGDLTLDLPLTASEGDYLVCKLSSFTKDDITWTYGQIAVWDNGWKKGGTYRVEGNTTTHKMSVEPTLVGQLPDFDEEKADEVFNSLETMTSEISNVREDLDDLEEAMGIAEADILGLQNRMNTAEQDIDKIEDGTTVVDKALKDDLGNTIKSTYANKIDLVYSSSNNRIAITLKSYDGASLDADLIDLPKATTSADGLLAKEDKVKINNIATDIASMGATKQSLSEKNQINGYAGLDGNAKIPSGLLPDSVLGQLEYKGTFTPTAYPLSPEKGWFYISIGNGTIGGVGYQVGDWAVYNGSTWDKIDNTDAVMSVNGKLGVVVLNGTDIQVGNGDTWTVEQRIVNIYAELNNRYTKAQTYSNTEIEQRITDLLGLANLQDTAIEFAASDYELDYNGTVVSTFPATLVSDYNWVFVRVLVGSQAEYTMFKPSVSTNGVGINLPLTQKDVYAEIMRNGSNFEFSLKKKNDNTLDTTTATMKAWGIKLDGINATEVDYDNSTSGLVADKVQGAIDEVVVELNTLDTKIDIEVATLDLVNIKQGIRINEIEEIARKSASGETSDNVLGTDIIPLNKNTANAPMNVQVDGGILEAPNLVVNGDFSNGTTGWTTTGATNIIAITDKITFNGTANANAGWYQDILINTSDKIYISLKLVHTTNAFPTISLRDYATFNNTSLLTIANGYNSFITTSKINGIRIYIQQIIDTIYTNSTIDDIMLFNISTLIANKQYSPLYNTTFDLMSDAQIKTQLDLWISKGILPNDNLLSVNMNKRVRSVGKNLFDGSLVSNNMTLNAFGVGISSSSNAHSDYINISPNKTYTIQGRTQTAIAFYDNDKLFISYLTGVQTFTTPVNAQYLRFNYSMANNVNLIQLELGSTATTYEPYVHSDLYLQANTKGYSLPNGVKDTIEYRNGKYYFVKRVDDTDLNNLVELSPYVETEIEAWGNLQGYKSGVVYVDDIKIDASVYASGITTTSEIKALDEIVKIINGVETQIDTSLAVIAVDKLSFTHPDLFDGDYVWFAYEEDGNYYKATTNITYYIDKLVRTSPDGSVWKLDWSVDNSGVITWTPTKI